MLRNAQIGPLIPSRSNFMRGATTYTESFFPMCQWEDFVPVTHYAPSV